ncbi:kelch domain-containing protein 4-like isoform X2 [Belonocnema kinseyi]|uniref:kelch domain-containing protein 4-like isoform X2 n=1 Tax=Belonocnema kinseyi TaxID=2817044 RepID=UPI00143CFB99|nr:kelch domain-containing protein 4-like isoform X2 [Belonocnema kinseyi]XP_033210933.1 kelch domain-containing protein 4-like isoform X2 [Belonocnema kinseyi]
MKTPIKKDDIEKIVAEIEKEEARRQRVVECVVASPSRRVNFTLSAHPFKDELIMFGGEFYDGQKTVVYGDLFFYNINRKEWTLVKAPGSPPPRCAHQAAIVPTGKGDLWIFGGEFSSPSESQFYHYRDLWVYHIGEKKWEKINASGGPSARSGHRMVYMKKQLFIFGGFYDNLREYKYFNDIHVFNISSYTWTELKISGNLPAARSGCIVLPTPENKLLVYGGYCKERIRKDFDKGQVHMDMFVLSPEKNDLTGTKWKWTSVRQAGIKITPRCSSSAILIQSNLAYMFGGVFDQEDNEEELHGTFFNDLVALNLEKYQWHTVSLNPKNDQGERRKRRKAKEDEEDEVAMDEPMAIDEASAKTVIADDGIFTVTVGPSRSNCSTATVGVTKESIFMPSPRINAGLVVKHNVLYLYGGMFEDGDKQYTLNDFYSLDCKKLDEWSTIIRDDLSSQEWLESSSSDSEDETDDSSVEACANDMDIEEK